MAISTFSSNMCYNVIYKTFNNFLRVQMPGAPGQ
jgi:hypothetical protein